MTPDANDLCVFAVKRGSIVGRFDVRNIRYSVFLTVTRKEKISLGNLTLEEPGYGSSATALPRTDEKQPKYIRITDFDDFGIPAGHKFMTAESYAEKHMLRKGDILFARTGGTVGKTYYYDGSIGPAVYAGYCIRFRFDEKKVFPKFVYWYTKTSSFSSWVSGIQRPSGQPNINKEEYKSFEIIVPSYKEQINLSQKMDYALEKRQVKMKEANDLLAGNAKYVLEKLELSFDSVQKRLFYAISIVSIEDRLDADYYSPKFAIFRKQIEESRYSAVCIGEICEKVTSGFAAGKQNQADNLPDDQRVPHLRPFSITPEGELSFETKKYVPVSMLKSEDYCQKNEIIFNNTNSPDLVGKTTVFDSDVLCATSNHMTRITVKEGVNPYYVAAFFNVLLSIGYWKLLCTNFNNQAGVNTDTLKKVKIPLPPKEVQDQIASELMLRRSQANELRKQAIKEWTEAKAEFERELLGESCVRQSAYKTERTS